jgi:hypothetical protein
MLGYSPVGGDDSMAGGRRKVTAKALRRALKKAGLKTTGKKAALTKRAKKAHLKVGGADKDCKLKDTDTENTGYIQADGSCKATPPEPMEPMGEGEDDVGGRRRSRRSRRGRKGTRKGFRLF